MGNRCKWAANGCKCYCIPRSMAPGKLHAATPRGNWPPWLTLAGHDAPGCCLASSRVSLPRGGSPFSLSGRGRLHRCWGGGNPSVAPVSRCLAAWTLFSDGVYSNLLHTHCTTTTRYSRPLKAPRLQIPFRVNSARRPEPIPLVLVLVAAPGHVTYGTGLSTEVSCHGNAAVEPPEQLRNNLPATLHTAAHPCAAQTD